MLKRQEKGGLFGGGPQHGNQAKGALSSFATKDQEGKVTIDTKGLRQAAEEAIGTRFTMRQDLVSIAEDFWIKNERGEKVIRVDGKLLRLRDVLLFEDRRGHELYTIKARMADIRETMVILRPNGSKAAVVHNALISPINDRWKINVPGGEDLVTSSGILQHEYHIKRNRQVIAEVSKKWISVADRYTVELKEPFDAPLVLAITVCIDMMSHNNANKGAGGISSGSHIDLL
jgi:uncharacterized protein YxjI